MINETEQNGGASNESAAVATTIQQVELAITSDANPKAGIGAGRKFLITPTGIKFLGKMTLEQWSELLAGWKWMGKDLYHIGLADIIEYGNERFGQQVVDEKLEFFGFDMADALKAHAIGQIPLDLRVVDLTSEHYFQLGKLLPGAKKEQGRWAAIAQKEKLSPSELKKSIEQGRIVRQKETDRESGRDTGIANIEGLALTFQRWEKQAGGEAAILQQSLEWKVRFLREIHPIVDVAKKIEGTLSPEMLAKVESGEPIETPPTEAEKMEANEVRLGPEHFHAEEPAPANDEPLQVAGNGEVVT